MPTPHISAQIGDIAPRIIMPGDPLRAKHIAQHYLEDVVLMNDIRNMLGYTGTYQGIKVSVMGSGMGIPSLAIYMSELIHHYGVHTFIRAGSAGTISNKVDIQSLVLCQAAASNSAFVDQYQLDGHISAIPDFDLLSHAKRLAERHRIQCHIGQVMSSDTFYHAFEDFWKPWAAMDIACLDMETYGMYLLAMKYKVRALSILTISDSLLTGEQLSADERQRSFDDMIQLALKTIVTDTSSPEVTQS